MATPRATLLDVMLDHIDRPHPDLSLSCWDTKTRSFVGVSYATLAAQAFGFGQRLINQGQLAGSVCMIACHSPYARTDATYSTLE